MKLQFNVRANLALLALLAITVTACSTQVPEQKKDAETTQSTLEVSEQAVQLPIGDNSQNALDWDGTYSGITPCASCEGIKTLLTLKRDNRYILESEYLGRSDKTFIEQGVFEWNSTGSKISLKQEPANEKTEKQFLVGENQLFLLDRAGNRVTGTLADSYRLIKIKPAR
ncbi:copper resistance protein NlpE [Shewanella canadensis]|uniref:Copper resistance protein NlpE n=1 Tax=Shewanella canadensis TaxID=271096 RepID=A0A3S0KC24_9GAMM|nr:copper resistance protein NlpE [Shewanella canadensis]RTR40012.1 copper resistance protein NlpE [Shewanella canadensis]